MTTCYCGKPLDKSFFEELRNHPIYDSFRLSADSTRLHLFVVPIGQSGKQFVDTNMLLCGMLPSPRWFECQSVQMAFYADDYEKVASSFDVEFWIGGERVLRVPALSLLEPKAVNRTILQSQNFSAVLIRTDPCEQGDVLGKLIINGTLYREKF